MHLDNGLASPVFGTNTQLPTRVHNLTQYTWTVESYAYECSTYSYLDKALNRISAEGYHGVVGKLSLNKENGPNAIEVPGDEELVGFYGAIREGGFLQSLGMILYKPPPSIDD